MEIMQGYTLELAGKWRKADFTIDVSDVQAFLVENEIDADFYTKLTVNERFKLHTLIGEKLILAHMVMGIPDESTGDLRKQLAQAIAGLKTQAEAMKSRFAESLKEVGDPWQG